MIRAFISSVQIVNPSKIFDYGLHKYNEPASSTDQTCVAQGTTPTAAQAGRLWPEGTSALFVSITSIIVILERFKANASYNTGNVSTLLKNADQT